MKSLPRKLKVSLRDFKIMIKGKKILDLLNLFRV